MRDEPVPLGEFLRAWGFDTPASETLARQALEEAGLTNPRKKAIHPDKLELVEQVLSSRFHVTCGHVNCVRFSEGRTAMQSADRGLCWECGNSDNQRATNLAVAALRAAKIQHVVVVGGSPAVSADLVRRLEGHVELRCVDGTRKRTQSDAQSDLRWADVILIAGGSILDHAVSEHYTRARGRWPAQVIQSHRRGVTALMSALEQHARGRTE